MSRRDAIGLWSIWGMVLIGLVLLEVGVSRTHNIFLLPAAAFVALLILVVLLIGAVCALVYLWGQTK